MQFSSFWEKAQSFLICCKWRRMLLSSQSFRYGIDWEVQTNCLVSLMLSEVILSNVDQRTSPAHIC